MSAVRLKAGSDERGVMTGKSSKRWIRNGSLWVFNRIQQSASDKVDGEFWAAFTAKDELDGKVTSTMPADAKESPEVRMDGENLESTSDVHF